MIEGQFPAFEKVIGVTGDKSVSLGREPLATALRRVSLLSSERSRAIRLSLQEGSLELAASSPDLGEARESLPVEYTGGVVEIGFNAQYILEFLAAVEADSVRLELKDSESQGVFRPDGGDGSDDYRYVVMPMRL
jgi:DNA polymerase-3 subunit beta